MARSQLVDDGLWELVEPWLPDRTPQRTGRPALPGDYSESADGLGREPTC